MFSMNDSDFAKDISKILHVSDVISTCNREIEERNAEKEKTVPCGAWIPSNYNTLCLFVNIAKAYSYLEDDTIPSNLKNDRYDIAKNNLERATSIWEMYKHIDCPEYARTRIPFNAPMLHVMTMVNRAKTLITWEEYELAKKYLADCLEVCNQYTTTINRYIALNTED